MTAYQLLPDLDPDDYNALRADIEEHGVRVPVDVDENGNVLDGHHRSLIAHSLGIDCPQRVLTGLTESEKVAHALAVNVHRRTLSREQKRELLATSIKAAPELSDREHARRTETSPTTAGDVRAELAAAGQVSNLDSRRGADGRTRSASQPARPPFSPASKPAASVGAQPTSTGAGEPIDRRTGEIHDPNHLPIEQHPDFQDQPAISPLAAARAEVARQPAIVAGKGIERLRLVRKTFEAAGTAAEIVADLDNDELVDRTGDWLHELDAALPLLNDLASRLRRRNLRSVKP